MTAIDQSVIAKRWTRRLRTRENLLDRAEKALARAHTDAERAQARKRVKLRKEQVEYAKRVIARNAPPKLSARERAVRAAMLGVKHRDQIAYSMLAPRWNGIARGCRAYRNEYPTVSDCSAFVTWCIWDALGGPKAGQDIVNGASWKAGYTGTQCSNGRRVPTDKVRRGDLVFYAKNGAINHVAIYVGDGKVVSHGSQPGPQVLAMHYRPVAQVRSYLP